MRERPPSDHSFLPTIESIVVVMLIKLNVTFSDPILFFSTPILWNKNNFTRILESMEIYTGLII